MYFTDRFIIKRHDYNVSLKSDLSHVVMLE